MASTWGTAATANASALSADLQIYYDNLFLKGVEENLVVAQFADVRTVPLYKGKVIDFFRRPPIIPTSTAVVEGSKTANQVDFAGQTMQATVKHYAFWSEYTRFLSLVSRDPELATLSKEFGVGAAKVIDDILMDELIMRGSVPLRSDELTASGTNTFVGVVDTSAGNSTTALYDAALDETTANFWSGAHIACYAPEYSNYGYGGQCSAYSDTTNIFTLSPAAPVAHQSGTAYRIVNGSGMATGSQNFTGSGLKYAVSLLKAMKAPSFDGGWYYALGCAEVEDKLMDDTVWLAVQEYHGEGDSLIPKGYIKGIWGAKWFRTTRPYRETNAGVASATGAVFCTPIIGRGAIARVNLSGQEGPRIIIKNPGPGDTSQPYNETKTIAADMFFTAKALNAAAAVNLMAAPYLLI